MTQFRDLTADEQRLIREIRALYFGHVAGLHIADGKAVLSPAPKYIRSRKTVRDERRILPPPLATDTLCTEVSAMLAEFASARDGIAHIDVAHGAPVYISTELARIVLSDN
jgi:hypothetical protein